MKLRKAHKSAKMFIMVARSDEAEIPIATTFTRQRKFNNELCGIVLNFLVLLSVHDHAIKNIPIVFLRYITYTRPSEEARLFYHVFFCNHFQTVNEIDIK